LYPLSKHFILRLAFTEKHPIDEQELLSWCHFESSDSYFQAAIYQLSKLHIFEEPNISQDNGKKVFFLNEYFQKSLLYSLFNPIEPWDDTCKLLAFPEDKKSPSTVDLEKFSKERWESLLYYLVSGHEDSNISETSKKFLEAAGLLQVDLTRESRISITSKGYEYILQSRQQQVHTNLSQKIIIV
jgi:hypothetical protein